mmetsp:Transcript_26111/g.54947  ORF Transcript_26111/g.54947 Transcript_26111/m.54947 type:complete len:83 (+) Transcript_26111:41-289(+)
MLVLFKILKRRGAFHSFYQLYCIVLYRTTISSSPNLFPAFLAHAMVVHQPVVLLVCSPVLLFRSGIRENFCFLECGYRNKNP